MIWASALAALWMKRTAFSTLTSGSASQRICTRPSVNVFGVFMATSGRGTGLSVSVSHSTGWFAERSAMADEINLTPDEVARQLRHRLESLRAAGIDYPPVTHQPLAGPGLSETAAPANILGV